MSRRLLLLLSALAVFCALPPSVPAAAQTTPPAPRLVTEFLISDATKVKFPSVAVRNGVVHVGAPSNEQVALYWSKSEAATAFGPAFEIGSARGVPDYSSISLFTTPDNTLYYAWASVNERRIKLRVRAPDGTWGPERTVHTSSGFAVFPTVAVSQGRIFVVWEDNRSGGGRTLYGKTSTDGGVTFSPIFTAVPDSVYSIPAALTVGPNGEVAIAYTFIVGDFLAVSAGIWNGTSFATERVSPSGGSSFGNPSIAYGSDGKLYVAYRGVQPTLGAYVAERQSSGAWAREPLASGEVEGRVNVVVDQDNTRHFAWQAKVSGTPRIFYAYQPAGQARSTAATSGGGSIFNPYLAVGNTRSGLAHVVVERFVGDVSRLYYIQFEGRAVPVPDATPTIAGTLSGQVAVVRMQDTIAITLTDQQNGPTELRWRWNTPLTPTEDDSGGWKPLSAAATIATKPDLPMNCTPVTLYTQVRNSANTGPVRSLQVRLDGTVDAAVAASNPYSKRKSRDFSDGTTVADLASSGGASDGDPDYTRAPVFYLELQSQSDCSGLRDVATGPAGPASVMNQSFTVRNGTFANVVPLPTLPSSDGPTSVLVRVADTVGNTRDYNQQFVYDTTAPTLSSTGPGVFSLGTTPSTLLVRLNFNGVQVSDNLYPAPGYWGIWVANSRTPVADPLTSDSLFWVPVETPGAGGQFSVPSWSLASGLPASQVTPGDYYVYVRFLDGAGNPSAAYLSAQTTLTQVTRPEMYMPLLQR